MSHPSNPKMLQRIVDDGGKTISVILSVEEYDLLIDAARNAGASPQLEESDSQESYPRGIRRPLEVAHRIANGENPVRVWREFRKLKAVTLSRSAVISPAYLSEIETGKKEGTFRTMAAIAHVLDVSLDELAPSLDDDQRKKRQRQALLDAVQTQVGLLVELISGPVDFNTGAVRKLARNLGSDVTLLQHAPCTHGDHWLDEVHSGVRAILKLVDTAETEIITTAARARDALEEVVKHPAFSTIPDMPEDATLIQAVGQGPSTITAD